MSIYLDQWKRRSKAWHMTWLVKDFYNFSCICWVLVQLAISAGVSRHPLGPGHNSDRDAGWDNNILSFICQQQGNALKADRFYSHTYLLTYFIILLLAILPWFYEISSSFFNLRKISLIRKSTAGHFDYEDQGGAKNKTSEGVFEVSCEETHCPSLKGSSLLNTTSYPITNTSHPTTKTSQQHSTTTILRPKRGRPVGQPPTEATLRRRRKVIFTLELIFCTFLV